MATARTADRLDSDIKSSVENLERLLQEKRAKEDSHVSLWPSCAASGDGYVGCNPAVKGHCPDEKEFETTFRGTPFANAFSKNMDTGEMERCVPAYLVGKPVSEQKRSARKQQSYQERLLRAAYTIEKNFEPLVEASSFQWNTPCENAQSRDQCEILRDAPAYDSAGNLKYAEHNTRCSWRPTEDKAFWETEDESARGPMCVPRHDQPYKYKPLTQQDLDEIKDIVASKPEPRDPAQRAAYQEAKDAQGLATPYGTRRQVKTTDPRDLQEALVQLPLLPTEMTLAYMRDKHDIDLVDPKTHMDYLTSQKFPGARITLPQPKLPASEMDENELRKYHQTLAQHIEDKLCDDTDAKWAWSPQVLAGPQDLQSDDLNQWLYSFLIPSKDGMDADYLTKIRAQVAKYAPKTWWRFGAQAALHQTHLINQFLLTKRQVEQELSDYKKLEALELSLTDITEVQDKDTVVLDTSFLLPLFEAGIIEVNPKLVSAGASQAKLMQGNHKVTVGTASLTDGAADAVRGGGKTVREILQKTPLFQFRGVYRSDKAWQEAIDAPATKITRAAQKYVEAKAKRFEGGGEAWRKYKADKIADIAKTVAIVLFTASTVAPFQTSKSDKDEKKKEYIREGGAYYDRQEAIAKARVGGGGGDDAAGHFTALRALHRRGLAPHIKWRAGVRAKVHVAFVGGDVDTNQAQYHKGVMRALERLQRLQVAEELKSEMAQEWAKNKQHNLTLSYFASLNAETDPVERYRIAISQIPKLIKHKMDDVRIVQHTASEIKRRFRNTPGHAMYFNRTIARKGDKAYALAVQAAPNSAPVTEKGEATPVTQHLYAAARFVQEVHDKLPVADKDTQEKDLVDKLTEFIQQQRQNLRSELSQGRVPHAISLNKARDFEERFGPGSYVNALSGTTLKDLEKAEKLQKARSTTA